MTDRQDPELAALAAVVRALAGLDREAQKRVLEYASEKLIRHRLNLDTTQFMENISKGFDAINQAAAKLNAQGPEKVSGLALVRVISQMYEEAAQNKVENETQVPSHDEIRRTAE